MRNILDEILSEIEREETQDKVRIGRISEELRNEFEENKKIAEAESNLIEAKIKEHINELKSIKEKFDLVKMELWEKVYDELNLTDAQRGDNYEMSARVIFKLTNRSNREETHYF